MTGIGAGGDGVGHGVGRGILATAEGVDDRGLVGGRLVLAELGLADHLINADLDADDGLKQSVEVIGRGVRGFPWMGQGAFVGVGEFVEEAAEPLRILDRADPAMDVDDLVVPGRHDPAGVGLRGVPTGRDVVLRAMEEDEAIESCTGLLPKGIGPGNVARQGSGIPRAWTMQERDVIGGEAGGVMDDHGAERLPADEFEEDFRPGLVEIGWAVHGGEVLWGSS